MLGTDAVAMVHRSKKDLWIVLMVSAGVVGPLVAGLVLLLSGHPDRLQGWILLLAGAGVGGVILLLAAPTQYEITPSTLIIRSGILRIQIPLTSIEEVQPTRNPLSAPAWSLDRLRIDYRKDGRLRFALISPQDKTAFLTELARTEPGLTLAATRVVRTSGR